MLPESARGGGVDLYRAIRFPDTWALEKRLLDFGCVDSSIFQAAGSWWMTTSPQVVPGHTMQLALAVDHRIVYGHHAAAFLGEVKAFLEEARI